MGLKLRCVMKKRLRTSLQRTRRLIIANRKRVLKFDRNWESVIASRKGGKESAIFLRDIERNLETKSKLTNDR